MMVDQGHTGDAWGGGFCLSSSQSANFSEHRAATCKELPTASFIAEMSSQAVRVAE